MKIEVINIFKELIYNIFFFPLPIFWLLLFVCFFIKLNNRIFYIKILTVIFFITLTPLFSFLLEYPLLKNSNNKYLNDNFSAVLVPTAGIYKDYNSKWYPSSNTILRVNLGEALAKKYKIPLIISGGKLDLHSPSESKITSYMLDYQNIILDTRSRNSYETSKNLKKNYN